MNVLRMVVATGLAVLGLALVAPVVIIASILEILNGAIRRLAEAMEPAHGRWRDLVQFDPEIGWKPKPNLDTHGLTDSDPEIFHVVTDDDGWPGRHSVGESDVVVFGDSIAFGYAIDHQHSFTEVTPGLKVKGIGAPGYNLVQELLLIRSLAPALAGKLVVWLVYYGNDLFDNLSPEMNGYRTPFVRSVDTPDGWEIVRDHVRSYPLRVSTGRHGPAENRQAIRHALHTESRLSERAFSASRYLLAEGKGICDAFGARLAVFTVPQPRYLSSAGGRPREGTVGPGQAIGSEIPDAAFTRICEGLDIPLVNGSTVLNRKHFRLHDDHWTREGHQRVAEVIAELYREVGTARRVSSPALETAIEVMST